MFEHGVICLKMRSPTLETEVSISVDVMVMVEVVVAVVVEVNVPVAVVVRDTVDSKEVYERMLAAITTAAIMIATARRVKLRFGALLV